MDNTQIIVLLVLAGVAALQYFIGRFLPNPLQGILPVAYIAFVIWIWFQQGLSFIQAFFLVLGLLFLIRFGASGMKAKESAHATN